MKDILKTGIILLIICFIAAMSLAFTNEVTKDKIAEQRTMANELAKKEVLPAAERFEDMEASLLETVVADYAPIIEAYIGYNSSDEVVGVVFKSTPTAFGGAVEVVTGIDITGEVTGLRIGSHQETPGLGAKAADEQFFSQYAGNLQSHTLGCPKLLHQEMIFRQSLALQSLQMQLLSARTHQLMPSKC